MRGVYQCVATYYANVCVSECSSTVCVCECLTGGLHASGPADAHHSDTEEGVATTAVDVHPRGASGPVLSAQSKHLHTQTHSLSKPLLSTQYTHIQWNLVSSNTQGNPKKVPLKECSTYPKCYNVSAKLFCVAKTSVAFVLLLFELLFGLTLPLSKPLTS